jgi:glycosyltransferase involved in cell wall biosynthesis
VTAERMSPTSISVAMTTRNGEAFLPEQLQSLSSQTRLPQELIICDDDSTDGTVGVIESFTRTAPFAVKLFINKPSLGVHQNFARALSLASGDLIFLSDQDDVWHADKLAKFENAFSDPKVGLVFGDAQVVGQDLRPRGYTTWQTLHFDKPMQDRVQQGFGFEVLLRHCFVAGALLAFRSSLRPLILPIPDELWAYDAWIAIVVAAASRAALVAEPVNDYRQHGAQQMGGDRKGPWRRYIEAKSGVDDRYFLKIGDAHQCLLDRLVSRHAIEPASPVARQLERKIQFARTRARMRQQPWLRWPLVGRELYAGNYWQLGQAFRSVLIDLFV